MNGPDESIRQGVIQPLDCISEAWAVIRDQYWMFVGICLVGMLIGSAAPLAILMGPMMCGIYWCFLDKWRGERVEFGTVFRGFERFLESFLVTLIMMAVASVAMIPMIVLFVAGILSGVLISERSEAMGPVLLVGFMGLGMIVLIVVMTAIGVVFTFTYLLIVDRNAKALDAVTLSLRAARANLGGLVGLLLTLMVMSWVGVCFCYVGAFFVMPLHFGAITCAYRKVFPQAAPAQ
jgi:uncharacterized membrane protein